MTFLIQPIDQGVCQKMKDSYKKSFFCKFISSKETVPDYQRIFNIKDAIFNVAMAWNDVKNSTLRKAWKKLDEADMVVYSSDEDEEFERFDDQNEFEGFDIQPILEIMSTVSPDHPKHLTEEDIKE